MKIIKYPGRNQWDEILARPVLNFESLTNSVGTILHDVRKRGDVALIEYTEKFDKVKLSELRVSETEITSAKSLVPDNLKKALKASMDNIKNFHEGQKFDLPVAQTSPGVKCWQKSVPIEKVGLYIPGGTAPLISTVLMLGIPAKLAGCKEIILCSPPDSNGKVHPAILYTAGLLGISNIFKIGGAQAIAAMAYGTETVPKVYKIFGPGNQYVTAAKMIVSIESTAIDMPAGPSEVAIIADDTAVPEYIASDLLSQAEHGIDSQVILISTSEKLIVEVRNELDTQLEKLPRKLIATEALKNSKYILVENDDLMVEIINEYAPEHLIIATSNYNQLAEKIVNAGSVFLGNYSPESAGDYASGTNHVLPTNGYAKAYSGVNVDNFMKKISFQELTKYGLFNIGPSVEIMADAEDLWGHKNAVHVRLNAVSKTYKNGTP
jgi:histidinol dehydrogenase